jgi:hypothetical protein
MNVLKKLKYRGMPHHCFTCNWFQMTYDEKGNSLNRFCKNPKKFTKADWKNHVCQNWVLAEDIEKRSLNIYGAVE